MFTVGKTLRFVWTYLQTNMQSAMEYRTSFLSQVFFMLVNNLMLLFFWWILFSRIDHLNGWKFSHIIGLYAVASGSFGFQALIFGGSLRLSNWISEGRIDHYLLSPKPVLLHLIVSHSMPSAWADILFAFAVFCWAINGDLGKLAYFPLFLITGGLVMTSFAVIVHSISFWIGSATNLAHQLYEPLLTFSLYPEGIFSPIVRIVLYTLIPAGFVSYLPVRILERISLGSIGVLIGAALIFTTLAHFIFYRGLRRYESGNLLVIRL